MQTKLTKEKLEQSKISIILDSYDDIFSDFDPRLPEERALSDDFINETKKITSRNRVGTFYLQLMIPEKERMIDEEAIIIKRLHSHFLKHLKITRADRNRMKKRGFKFIIIGMILMVGATYLSFLEKNYLYLHFLTVMIEPAAWFSIWTGFDQIIMQPKQNHSEFSFYQKMCESEIVFIEY